MILKFDHISFSCEKKEFPLFSIISGYELQFQEVSLKNLNCKQTFLQSPHADHDIYMYENKQLPPIEITAYDTCFKGRDSMSMENGMPVIFSPNPEKTAAFLVLFGLKQTHSDNTESVLEGNFVLGGPITIRIKKADTAEWKLDKAGWSSICFLSSDSFKELKKLSAAGYAVTDVEELDVNQKRMSIGFCKGPFGEIIEIISVKRSNES